MILVKISKDTSKIKTKIYKLWNQKTLIEIN